MKMYDLDLQKMKKCIGDTNMYRKGQGYYSGYSILLSVGWKSITKFRLLSTVCECFIYS
jgi:hypothetical protein